MTSSRLAISSSAEVASRTAPTLPGAESGMASVWTESITQAAGLSASSAANTLSSEGSASIGTDSAASPSRSARRRTCAADSSPET